MAENDQQNKLVFSDEIIVEILSYLPFKSLLRFRCVSKSWRALISSSYFNKKRYSRAASSTNSSALIRFLVFRFPPTCSAYYYQLAWFNEPPPSPEVIDYHALKNPSIDGDHVAISTKLEEYPDILENLNHYEPLVGSCNGLICLHGLIEEGALFGNWRSIGRYILWNPSTRKIRKLPDLDYFRGDPSYYGFGYDSTTQDYKVVLGKSRKTDKIAIFALKTGAWKIVKDLECTLRTRAGEDSCSSGKGHFLKGALHWLDYYSRVWSFDLADEKFRILSFFSFPESENRGISTTQNDLYYYSFNDHRYWDRDDAITIWAMMEYGVDESWTKILNIASKTIPEEVYKYLSWGSISVLEDGEVLMKSTENGLVVLYDPKDETCRCVWESAAGTPPIEVAMYEETLVSPTTGGVPYMNS